MKKIILSAFLLSGIFCMCTAQTNTFPSTGAAGIGTITPDACVIAGDKIYHQRNTNSPHDENAA